MLDLPRGVVHPENGRRVEIAPGVLGPAWRLPDSPPAIATLPVEPAQPHHTVLRGDRARNSQVARDRYCSQPAPIPVPLSFPPSVQESVAAVERVQPMEQF